MALIGEGDNCLVLTDFTARVSSSGIGFPAQGSRFGAHVFGLGFID